MIFHTFFNSVFGKFDSFCARLDKVQKLVNALHSYSALSVVKLEGLEPIINKVEKITEIMHRKQYDFLDIRQTQFDNDYVEFEKYLNGTNQQLQNYIDSWFEMPLTVMTFIELLDKLESLQGINLNLEEKYVHVLQKYDRDVERVKHLYNTNKKNPPVSRNLPPVASKISWARQLYYSIEGPMNLMRDKDKFMKTQHSRPVIANYNKVAKVLVEFETLYYTRWCATYDYVLLGLQSTVLVQDRTTGKLYTNFDPKIWELLDETKFFHKLGLKIPESAETLMEKTSTLKHNKLEMDEILKSYERISEKTPPVLSPVMPVVRSRFEKRIEPGLLTVTWRSVGVENFLKICHSALNEFKGLVESIDDLIKFRIDERLSEVSETPLIEMPHYDDQVNINEFVVAVEKRAQKMTKSIGTITRLVESAVNDLITILEGLKKEKNQKEEDDGSRKTSSHGGRNFRNQYLPCAAILKATARDAGSPVPPAAEDLPRHSVQRCGECENCIFYTIISHFTQQKTDALFRCAATVGANIFFSHVFKIVVF